MATPLPNRALPRFTRANYGTILPQEFVPEANIAGEAVSTFSALRAKRLEEEKKNLTEAAKKEQNEITWLIDFKRTNQDLIDKNLNELGINNAQVRDYITNDLLDQQAYYSMLANRETSDGKLRLSYQKTADQYSNRIENTIALMPSVNKAKALYIKNYEEGLNTINSEGGVATVGVSELERKIVDALTVQAAGMGNNVSETLFYDENTESMAVRINSDEIRLKYGPGGIVLNQKDYASFEPRKVPKDTKELEEDLTREGGMFINGKLNKEKYEKSFINKDGMKVTYYDNDAIERDLEAVSSAIAQSRLSNGNNAQISYQNTLLPFIGDEKINFEELLKETTDPEIRKQLKEMQAKGKTYKEALPALKKGDGNIGGSTYDIISQTLYIDAFDAFAAKKFKIKPASTITKGPGKADGSGGKVQVFDIRASLDKLDLMPELTGPNVKGPLEDGRLVNMDLLEDAINNFGFKATTGKENRAEDPQGKNQLKVKYKDSKKEVVLDASDDIFLIKAKLRWGAGDPRDITVIAEEEKILAEEKKKREEELKKGTNLNTGE